jgi:hypothetical protein
LQLHFLQQLDKLVANGFIEFPPGDNAGGRYVGISHQANLTGDGAIAQAAGATAVARGGVVVGGNNSGNINTGTQTTTHTGGGAYVAGILDTGGGSFVGRDSVTTGVSARELEPLFAPLLAAVAKQASPGMQAAAVQQVEQLKAEVGKGKQADDSKTGKIVEGLIAMVPGAVSAVVSTFATPLLGGIVGPVTKFVLDRWKTD